MTMKYLQRLPKAEEKIVTAQMIKKVNMLTDWQVGL